MPRIAVSGATGNLGGLVIDHLIAAGVPKEDIVPLVRSSEKARPFSERGLSPRVASYDDPAALTQALAGISRFVFIPAPVLETVKRLDLHHGVVMAASRANLDQIAWVSFSDPEERPFGMEDADIAIEYTVRATGIPFTILRNSVYLDEIGPELAVAAQSGRLLSSTDVKSFNWAARDDQAAAIAASVIQEGHLGATYNLVSPETYTYDDVARLLSEATGRDVFHRLARPDEVEAALIGGGMGDAHAHMMVHDFHAAIAASKFHSTSNDIERLSRRSGKPSSEYLRTLVERGFSVNWAS